MSKVRLNLYLPSMRPIKEKLPLNTMVICWVIMSLMMGGLSFYFQHRFEQIDTQRRQASIELDVSKKELETLEQRHADFKPSPRLMTTLDRLTQELNGKRFLSQHLKGRAAPKEQKYSQVMVDLAKLHSNNLWVTDMRFEEDKVAIKGFALDALAVPKWLNELQQSPYFSGKSFALMNIKNESENPLVNQQGVIEFEISTVAEASMSEEEKMAAIKALSAAEQK